MVFLIMGSAAFFISGANATFVAVDWMENRTINLSNGFWCLFNIVTGTLCMVQA